MGYPPVGGAPEPSPGGLKGLGAPRIVPESGTGVSKYCGFVFPVSARLLCKKKDSTRKLQVNTLINIDAKTVNKILANRNFPGGPVGKTELLMQRAWV